MTHRDDLGRRRVKPWIVCAAIRHGDGRMLLGARHWDLPMHSAVKAMDDVDMRASGPWNGWESAEQGFVDQHGTFYTREQAWIIALANGQLDPKYAMDSKTILISEDIY